MKILSFTPKAAISCTHRPEEHFKCEWSLIDLTPNAKMHTDRAKVTVRTYQKGAFYFVCVWINCTDPCMGSAKVKIGNYGDYSYQTKAFLAAIKSAGVEVSEPKSDHFTDVIPDTIRAIAYQLNIQSYYIHYAHA